MFNNKTILVTGASGGIGSAIAKKLSSAGAALVLVGLNQDELEKLNQELGGQHHALQADISSDEGREAIFQFCQQLNNGIDILINNAGIGQFSLFQKMESDHLTAIININLTSTILLTQKLLPLLLARPDGQIVNVGSIFGSIGYPGSSIYCASKFGIRGFTEALNRELMDTKVSVSYFAPRATNTAINNEKVVEMNNELGTKMDSPEDVAEAFVKFVNSSRQNFYMGWPEKLFVRINSVIPSIVDKSLLKQLPIIKRYL